MTTPVDLTPEKVRLAILAADIHFRMDSTYVAELERIVFHDYNLTKPIDAKELLSIENKLATKSARDTLTYIWRNSENVPGSDLEALGYGQRIPEAELTSRSLSKEFFRLEKNEDPDAFSAIERDISRIIKAALAYGLIEYIENPPNRNSRPIKGTPLLHRLITSVNLSNAQLIGGLKSRLSAETAVREASR